MESEEPRNVIKKPGNQNKKKRGGGEKREMPGRFGKRTWVKGLKISAEKNGRKKSRVGVGFEQRPPDRWGMTSCMGHPQTPNQQ